jgi:Raf kinase inhibitor-like YbhB/YbcL family protein
MEDPDAQLPKPFIHWVMYDIPPDTTALRQGLPTELLLKQYNNIPQGINSRGSIGYFGPRPPYKDADHHYHFMIFALDKKLNMLPGADRNTLLSAMKGHVIASGTLVGTYQATDPK